jgi:glycosyltransferase involved in cell wall biosynthesis
VIPNGIPVPLQSFKKADPPIISWIANIKPLKQPELFIKLAEKCQDLNAQFIYAGRPGSGKFHRTLIEKTKKLINLQYIGEIPFEKTNELLSLSSIFVNTSLPIEGFPNTYIQAWLRETPVIALNFDPDDLLKRKKIGFHSKSFEQLVEDIRYLIDNEDERRKMGERARKYAIENHDINNIYKKYIELFHQLSS